MSPSPIGSFPLGTGTARADFRPAHSRRGRLDLFGHRSAPQHAATGPQESLNGQVVPDVPADTPAP
jgi:hypothetical protein